MCDSGARSPDAPTEPCAGTTGMTSLASIASSNSMRLRPHAGCALRQAGELQRHHQPGDRDRHRLADAGGMRQHDVALQGFEIGGGNAHAGQFSEAGVDAIDRLALGDDARDGLGAGLDLWPAGRDRASAPRRDRWRASRQASHCRASVRVRSLSSPDAGMQRVEAHAVDEFGRALDVPDRQIGRFAGLKRAGLGRAARARGRPRA